MSAESCITLGSLSDADAGGEPLLSTAWMVSDKNYSLAMLTKLQLVHVRSCRNHFVNAAKRCSPPGTEFDVLCFPTKPLCAVPSTDWFAAVVYEQLIADDKRDNVTWTQWTHRLFVVLAVLDRIEA